MHEKALNGVRLKLLSLLLALLLSFTGLVGCAAAPSAGQTTAPSAQTELTEGAPPEYSGSPSCEVVGNVPGFTDDDKARSGFEDYSDLDPLGRCGVAFALIGTETMPTEERGSIGEVKPSGWHTVRYNGLVDGNYLYNRCHLIGFQLAGENANPLNLITGTRYMNTEGMLPYENQVADYVHKTKNHVLYRVTPVFEGDELVARGVQMEAWSVEDSGRGVSFNVFCFNVQPGIDIDYATGDSRLSDGLATEEQEQDYVLNTNTKKFHLPSCDSANDMKAANRQETHAKRSDLVSQGYEPCGKCNP